MNNEELLKYLKINFVLYSVLRDTLSSDVETQLRI